MTKILLRADDLGFSEGVNYGILRAIENGVISDVGFMTNMDASYHAAKLVSNKHLSIGLHVNISVGSPLLKPELVPSLIGENNEFKKSSEYNTAKLDLVHLNEALLEVEAQLQMFKKLMNREPTYIDIHAVSSQGLRDAVSEIARRHDILDASIDLSQINDSKIGNLKVLYHSGSNETVNVVENLKNIIEQSYNDVPNIIVYHPGFVDQYILKNSSLTIGRTIELEALCSKEMNAIIDDVNVELISYEELVGKGE